LVTQKSPEVPAVEQSSNHTGCVGWVLPELLAPAGDWDCAKAAVENGADAIYFGLEKFNARMRANNFTETDLPKLMDFLHRRGVKGYLTFNTLVFENEWEQAQEYLRTAINAGVDAAIVQDVGICRLIRQMSSNFPIHVSTQMTITSAGGVEFARRLGCNLVVLARECSLKEIEKIQEAQREEGSLKMERGARSELQLPLEVFVHGALCVAYSGQCLTSEALGGRSANRGECAQACRMPYDLIADGKQLAMGDRKYLLSPQDLVGLEVLPELARLGVASLKIEGRLKSPEYVASITRVYRRALDELAGGRAREGRDSSSYELEMAFSRGLYTGWFHGTNNQRLVHARFGKKRGVFLGEVTRVQGDQVWIRLEGLLKPGDGVVFDAGKPEGKEEGGRVFEVTEGGRHEDGEASDSSIQPSGKPQTSRSNDRGGHVALSFGRGTVDFGRIHVGDKVWKTSDPALDRELRQTFEGSTPRYQRPLAIEVHGRAGETLSVIARDSEGSVVRVVSKLELVGAVKQPLSTERLREQLGRLGGTPFNLEKVDNQLEGEVLLPVSELNRLRREMVIELESLRARPKKWTLTDLAHAEAPRVLPSGSPSKKPVLIALARNLPQLETIVRSGIKTVYCEFENPRLYRDAVVLFRSSAPALGASSIFVAPPRIFKMGEEWTLKQVRSCDADGYLVRNYDHLKFFEADRKVGDFSLNIANRMAADYFKNEFGLERLTASYDLNFTQLEALLKAAPPEWFEITIHQHIPMFHMEHCVFCAFLSQGTDYTNCGRPCDRHDLKLRDRVGAEHPVKADVGCRNTVFNALAQTGAEFVSRFMELGVRHFRIEFLNDPPGVVERTISMYRSLLAGDITGAELWRELKLLNQLGVTRGQMPGGRS
jgi:putative protease